MATKQAPATHNAVDDVAPAMRRGHLYLNATTGRYECWDSLETGKTEAFLNGSASPITLDDATRTRPIAVDDTNRVRI